MSIFDLKEFLNRRVFEQYLVLKFHQNLITLLLLGVIILTVTKLQRETKSFLMMTRKYESLHHYYHEVQLR
jgi:hypothetical protein